MKRSVLPILVLATVFSCSKQSDSNNDKTQVTTKQVPEKIEFVIPQRGADLTKDQIANIKSTFNRQATMELPPSAMLLKDSDEKLSENDLYSLKQEEARLQKTSSRETFEMYKSMRAQCKKQQLQTTHDLTIPMENIKKATDLKAGDRMLFDASAAYSGANCDVEVGGSIGYGAKVEKMDQSGGLVSGGAKYNVSALLKNTKYADFLKSKGLIVTASTSALVAKQNINTKDVADAKGMVSFDISGSYFTESAQIPYKTSYQIHAKGLGGTSSRLQMIVHADIKMPSFDAAVDMEVITDQSELDGSKVISQKAYVNGIEKTQAELKDLFGSALELQQTKTVTSTVLVN